MYETIFAFSTCEIKLLFYNIYCVAVTYSSTAFVLPYCGSNSSIIKKRKKYTSSSCFHDIPCVVVLTPLYIS